MSIQFKANQLSEDNKQEAEKIARRLFGVYNWQGCLQEVSGYPGMAEYINRVVIRKIKPEGSNWLVGEQQYLADDGWLRSDDYFGYERSTYYIKRF